MNNSSVAKAGDDALRRLELAQRYVIATHRERLEQDVYAKQLHKAMAGFCKTTICQSELDEDIRHGAKIAAREYVTRVTPLLAQKLSIDELSAAVKLSESPIGQSITKTTEGMTGEMASIGHDMSMTAYREIFRRFCASHLDSCPRRPKEGYTSDESSQDRGNPL